MFHLNYFMLIERAIVVSLMIVATHISMEVDMWLEWLRRILSKIVPESSVWSKPLYNCVGCMASVWGVFYYCITALTPYFGFSLIEMVIVCVICIPLNFIFIKLS